MIGRYETKETKEDNSVFGSAYDCNVHRFVFYVNPR